MPIDLSKYEEIDGDPEDDPAGNLAHCQRLDRLGWRAEWIVYELLRTDPVQVQFRMQTAEFAIVGPDGSSSRLWLVLFDTSWKRGDWLRPVTG